MKHPYRPDCDCPRCTPTKAGRLHLIERFPTARPLWEVTVKGVGDLIAYSVNASVVIIHEYEDRHGWQVYTPTTESGDIKETLDAIDARTRGIDYDWRGR